MLCIDRMNHVLNVLVQHDVHIKKIADFFLVDLELLRHKARLGTRS